MIRNTFITFFVIILIFFIGVPKITLSFDCVLDLNNNSSQAQKNICQNELNELLSQVALFENQLANQVKQTGTIKGDVSYLTNQINALKAKIKSRALAITTLKVSINEKSSKIQTLAQKIESEKESLAQLIRNTNQADNDNFIHLVFSDQTLSGFYSDLESYSSIKIAIKKSVDAILGIKNETEEEKADLQKKQDAETDAKAELELAQKKVTKSEAEKKELLALSKQKESDYQKLLAEKKVRADKIRNALFPLAGVSKAIPFSEALIYANEAKSKTGIDPAFLLAILTQESNLGSNVGQCNKIDDPEYKKWNKIMPGPEEYQTYLNNRKTCKGSKTSCSSRDDQTPFMKIVSKLGFNINGRTISCPIYSAGPWGGAMGPAQFIPSTWNIFIDRLQSNLNHYPNPWEPEDAFMASSMYLTDLGGVGNSVSAQTRAACKYYGSGGSTCSYGRSVINLKNKIQGDIDLLSY